MKTTLQLFKMNKTLLLFSLSLFTTFGVIGQTNITSVAELATAASNSNQNIVMEPGVYQMEERIRFLMRTTDTL